MVLEHNIIWQTIVCCVLCMHAEAGIRRTTLVHVIPNCLRCEYFSIDVSIYIDSYIYIHTQNIHDGKRP